MLKAWQHPDILIKAVAMSSKFASEWKWCNDHHHHPYSNFHQIIIIFCCLSHQMTISMCTFDLLFPAISNRNTDTNTMIIIKCEKITLNEMWKKFHLFYSIQPRWHILGNCQMAHSYAAATVDNKEDIMKRKFMWIKMWFMQASAILVDGINGNIKITLYFCRFLIIISLAISHQTCKKIFKNLWMHSLTGMM